MATGTTQPVAPNRSTNNKPWLTQPTPGAERLARLPEVIDYIPNAAFRNRPAELDELVEAVLARFETTGVPADLPAHLRRICDVDLLTAAEETALFREMNYLKYRACELRDGLDQEDPDPEAVHEVRALLAKSTKIRDHLIKANTRLVISVVKQFVTPQQSFDDLLSEGIYTLMQAVEKFDFDRGFRFSTYAYRSIARNAYRVVKTAHKEESRVTRDAEEWAFGEGDASLAARRDEQWSNLSELTTELVRKLDRREQFIIRSRYALGAHRKKRTFQFLADKLGVSKERARQLEKRALEKLQDMAADLDIDDLSGSIVTAS